MFGIPVSLYFINSLLTITIFQTLLLLLQRKWKGEKHVTIIFTVFLFVVCSSRQMPCCPGLLWEASHVKRLEELVTRQILVPSYGIFSSGFPVDPSRPVPYRTGLFLTRDTSITASWRTRKILLLSYGTFLSRLSSPYCPMPYHPGLLLSNLPRVSWLHLLFQTVHHL